MAVGMDMDTDMDTDTDTDTGMRVDTGMEEGNSWCGPIGSVPAKSPTIGTRGPEGLHERSAAVLLEPSREDAGPRTASAAPTPADLAP